MQEDCSFVGNYKELRKHVRSKHPFARPREVDPIREEKWKRFKCKREQNDVINKIVLITTFPSLSHSKPLSIFLLLLGLLIGVVQMDA